MERKKERKGGGKEGMIERKKEKGEKKVKGEKSMVDTLSIVG